jgi:hypothetical protein
MTDKNPPDFTERGATNYRGRTNWVRQGQVLSSKASSISSRAETASAALQALIRRIQKVLDDCGVSTEFYQVYISYGEALDKAQRGLKWMVDRRREHQILRDRWGSRGLDPHVLDRIDETLIYNYSSP